MRLPVEDWVASQRISGDAGGLLDEAVTCFKAGAYRAALLMSYLGFQSILRDRMLSAPAPAGIPGGMWDSIQKRLRSDDEWDFAAFDATQQQKPAPIFPITEDLRAQIAYWKNRRNDCAHSKPGPIAAAHVEVFWIFARSHLPKLAVNGSVPALIEKVLRHYDRSFTAPGTDTTPLARELGQVVETRQLPNVLTEIEKALSQDLGAGFPLQRRAELFDYFECVLRCQAAPVSDALAAFLAADEDRGLGFLRAYPERVLLFAREPALLRRLWFSRLFESGHHDFALYVALLRNSLIPPADLIEAHVRVLDRLRGEVPTPEQVEVLDAANFFPAFENYAFEGGMLDKFKWGPANAQFIRWYVETRPLTDTVVRSICTWFSATYIAVAVRDELQSMFEGTPEKVAEFKAKMNALGIGPPTKIPALA